MTRIYTRSGDDGTTGLFNGQRVGKDHLRVEAYGAVDELNSLIGWVLAACEPGWTREGLTRVQSELFDLGADLATPAADPDSPIEQRTRRISSAHLDRLEAMIDQSQSRLEPLETFILPGGCELASRLHVARAVCRRAERQCVHLSHAEPISEEARTYLNRLSDLLFTLARLANHEASVPDEPWRKL